MRVSKRTHNALRLAIFRRLEALELDARRLGVDPVVCNMLQRAGSGVWDDVVGILNLELRPEPTVDQAERDPKEAERDAADLQELVLAGCDPGLAGDAVACGYGPSRNRELFAKLYLEAKGEDATEVRKHLEEMLREHLERHRARQTANGAAAASEASPS